LKKKTNNNAWHWNFRYWLETGMHLSSTKEIEKHIKSFWNILEYIILFKLLNMLFTNIHMLSLVEQELPTPPTSSTCVHPIVVVGFVLLDLVDHCLSFCPFSFGHCVVCCSSNYGFWIPLWYLQTLLSTNKPQKSILYQKSMRKIRHKIKQI
jgi:hypothetical protein